MPASEDTALLYLNSLNSELCTLNSDIFDTWADAFYTVMYEHHKSLFFAPIGDDFYHVVGGFGGFGMDGANNVHDEIRP